LVEEGCVGFVTHDLRQTQAFYGLTLTLLGHRLPPHPAIYRPATSAYPTGARGPCRTLLSRKHECQLDSGFFELPAIQRQYSHGLACGESFAKAHATAGKTSDVADAVTC
jgi:hypothetical protein